MKIVQRGAVPPLIAMLKASDRPLKEMAAFALGRLAQTNDNQAGIFAMGALAPLLELLHSKAKNLEHNAAFALYGLTDNADNAPEIVKQGGYEQLRTSVLPEGQATKDCISKTLKRLAVRRSSLCPSLSPCRLLLLALVATGSVLYHCKLVARAVIDLILSSRRGDARRRS